MNCFVAPDTTFNNFCNQSLPQLNHSGFVISNATLSFKDKPLNPGKSVYKYSSCYLPNAHSCLFVRRPEVLGTEVKIMTMTIKVKSYPLSRPS